MRPVVLLLLGACSFGVPAGTTSDAGADTPGDVDAPACFQARCRRIAIAVDHTKVVGGPHADFPLFVQVTDPDLDRGLVFANGNGTTMLPFEIETLRVNTVLAWVRLPMLPSATDTTIQLYFGDPTAADTSSPADVWDAGYQAVWHLGEAPGALGGNADSTSKHNDTLPGGTPAIGAAGKLGRAVGFDGIDDNLRVPQSASLTATASQATLSMWINWTTPLPADFQRLLMSSNTFAGDGSGMEWATNSGGQHYYYPASAGSNNYASIQEMFIAGAWHHVALTQDFATQAVQIFVDGAAQPKTVDNTPGMWTTLSTAADWYWGGMPPNARFLGAMDEIRVSNVIRSAGWIATEFANQNSPTTFYRVTPAQP